MANAQNLRFQALKTRMELARKAIREGVTDAELHERFGLSRTELARQQAHVRQGLMP